MSMRTIHFAFASALLLICATAGAQDDLQRCARIADDADRLACFDALAASIAPAAGQPIAETGAAPTATAEFGREHIAPAPDDEDAIQELRLKVVSARHTDFTGWTIAFDNGQTWKQIGSERFDVKVGESYVIKRGVMNSFQLQHEGSGRRIRIRREE